MMGGDIDQQTMSTLLRDFTPIIAEYFQCLATHMTLGTNGRRQRLPLYYIDAPMSPTESSLFGGDFPVHVLRKYLPGNAQCRGMEADGELCLGYELLKYGNVKDMFVPLFNDWARDYLYGDGDPGINNPEPEEVKWPEFKKFCHEKYSATSTPTERVKTEAPLPPSRRRQEDSTTADGACPSENEKQNEAPAKKEVSDSDRHRDICKFAKERYEIDDQAMDNPFRRGGYDFAYDFKDTSDNKFNVDGYFKNWNLERGGGGRPPDENRINSIMNMATNAFLKTTGRQENEVRLLGLREFPKVKTRLELDFASLLGPIFYQWVVMLPMVQFGGQLVYEKEKRLRMMMKMQGLGDFSYAVINGVYMLVLMLVYLAFFVFCGSILGLNFFRRNSYSVQIVFYILTALAETSFTFLLTCFFSKWRTMQVVGSLYIVASGLLGQQLFGRFIVSTSAPESAVYALEILFPAFTTYRGLYELAEAAFQGVYTNSDGLTWAADKMDKGMGAVMGIYIGQIIVFTLLYVYLEQVIDSGKGIPKHPLFCLGTKYDDKASPKDEEAAVGAKSGKAEDVLHEEQRVKSLGKGDSRQAVILLDGLKKVYPARAGDKPKLACRSLTLAVADGECFGLLGPNGAGKSTSINMMVGFLVPTDGTAYIQGKDIRSHMNEIYLIMGCCPQHDLIWEQLSVLTHIYAMPCTISSGSMHVYVHTGLYVCTQDSIHTRLHLHQV
jgi:hypothetical protein